ncbi:MAG: recombinase family protein, partial [Oscillospiraceae bacterium]
MAGVADLERSNILDRMWLGANRAAHEGKWLGGIVPYGYLKGEDKYLHVNEMVIPNINMTEADVVKLIYKHIVDGKNSLIETANYLNALGVPTHYELHHHTGKRIKSTAGIWRPNRVGSLVKNSVYKGIHIYGKRSTRARELITRSVPAIVDELLWEQAQLVIANNFIISARSAKSNYLLRTMIVCENCGQHYHGTVRRENEEGKSDLKYYVCNRRTM